MGHRVQWSNPGDSLFSCVVFVLWDRRHWQLQVTTCVCSCLCCGFLNSWADGRTELSLFLQMSNPVCLDSCSIARLVSESVWSQAELESGDRAGLDGVSGVPSLILYGSESNQLAKWSGIFSASQIWLICSMHDSGWIADILSFFFGRGCSIRKWLQKWFTRLPRYNHF